MDKIKIQGTRDWHAYGLRNAAVAEINRVYTGIISRNNDEALKLAKQRQLELLAEKNLTLIPPPYGEQQVVFEEARDAGREFYDEASRYMHLRQQQFDKVSQFCDVLNKNYERRSYNFVLTDLPELCVFYQGYSPSNKYYVRNNSKRSIVTTSEHWTNFFNIIGELTL